MFVQNHTESANSLFQQDTGKYKYGFNGQEKVDELKGSGNSYDFGARIYDPRVGRWLSVDPEFKKATKDSPYDYSFNNPIFFIEKDGEWPISTHYNMTFDAVIKLGYSSRVADLIAHGASTVADHPDADKNGVVTGAPSLWASVTIGAGGKELNYRKDSKINYDKYKNSQSYDDVDGLIIHATRSFNEENSGFTKEQAITRTLNKAKAILNKYDGADLEKLTTEELIEIGVAIHMIQDVSAHKGATWAKKFKQNEHNVLTMDAFGDKTQAIKDTDRAVSKVKNKSAAKKSNDAKAVDKQLNDAGKKDVSSRRQGGGIL